VALAITGNNIPEIVIRVESDVLDCAVSANFYFPNSFMLKFSQISQPGQDTPFYIVVLKVSLHRPLTSQVLTFWSKESNGEPNPAFRFDDLNFFSEYSLHTSIGIRIPRIIGDQETKYDFFFNSLKGNFSKSHWVVLR
jgi:hypothetical protein